SLARGLGRRAALGPCPDADDFKPQLRERGLAHLHKRGHHDSAARAERMANVLPPRHGGVMAAIRNAPDADIVFVAHTLFEDVGSIGQLWQRIPLKEPVLARFWRVPVSEVPEGTEELIAWLYGWWSRIGAWSSDMVHEPDEVLDDLTEDIAVPPTSDLSDPSTTLP